MNLNPIITELLARVSNFTPYMGMICDEVLPTFRSERTTGQIGKYGKQHLKSYETRVVGDAPYPRVDIVERDTTTYAIDQHALYSSVSVQEEKNSQGPFMAQVDATIALVSTIKLQKEKAFIDLLDASTSVGNANLKARGNADRISDPTKKILSDVAAAQETILDATGVYPDAVIVPAKVYNRLRYLDELKTFYRQGGKRSGGPMERSEIMAALLPDTVNGRMFIPSTPVLKSGSDTEIQQQWPNSIFYLVAPRNAGIRQTTFGYRIAYTRQALRAMGATGMGSRFITPGVAARGGEMTVIRRTSHNPPDNIDIFVNDNYKFLATDVNSIYEISNLLA